MKLYRLFLILAVVLLGGCRNCRAIHVCMHGELMRPVEAHVNVKPENPPCDTSGPVTPFVVTPGKCGQPRVAIVDVDGLLVNTDITGPYSLGENPISIFREKLDAVARDPAVMAVVLRINSPGGGVTASDIMWQELLRFRNRTQIPVVACLMDLGTGGGYYLATAADLIFAHPTSVTGGIGVILNLYNLREAMGYFNVLGQPIKSGPNIDMGTSAAPLSPEARKMLQAMADEFHQRFRRVVTRARPQVDAADGTNFDGRVFTASQALERRLIDRIGYLDDALAAARDLAGLADAEVVLYHRPDDPARTPYALTPNIPLQNAGWMPVNIPGLDRSRLPSFLYLWQPEATLEKLGGK
jgi:protease-4